MRAAIGAQLQNALSPRELESRPGAATLSDTLFVALRLWTGPMREKYNAVLRAAPATPHAAPFTCTRPTSACARRMSPGKSSREEGREEEEGAGRGGAGAGLGDSTTIPYAQTIHAINLAVCMLSRLTRAGVVYRAPPCATAAVPPPSLPAPPLPADHLAASHNDLAAAAAEANLNTNTAAAAQANTNTAAPPWPPSSSNSTASVARAVASSWGSPPHARIGRARWHPPRAGQLRRGRQRGAGRPGRESSLRSQWAWSTAGARELVLPIPRGA